MMRRKLQALLCAAVLAISLGIVGCNNESATAPADSGSETPAEVSAENESEAESTAETNEDSEVAEEPIEEEPVEEATAPDIILSGYDWLKSGECVFIAADGTETIYMNKTTTGGGTMSKSGLAQLEEYLLELRGSNSIKFKDTIEDAIVVAKGDVTAIYQQADCYAVFITWAYKTTTLGNTFTPEPGAAIEMSEDEIREQGIDLESEFLVAGYIDSDLHDGSWRYAELSGPTDYNDGLIVLKSPALGEVVEDANWK